MAIFTGQELVTQLKYKLDNRCSNNQAEQLAIAKALEALESIYMEENSPHSAAIITDSRVALDSIKNFSNHSYLIEEIRKGLSKLARSNWTVAFSWVKSHAGILGNELADQLAKAARDKDMTIDYSRIPTSTLYRELEVETEQKWQKKLGRKFKGSPKKTVLSKHIRQTQIEDKRNLQLHCNSDRTREDQSLPTPV